jgi:hypothetical protein
VVAVALHKSEKLSQAEIARQLSLSRNTVAKALRSQASPRYERAPVTTSAWAAVEPAVRALLMQDGARVVAAVEHALDPAVDELAEVGVERPDPVGGQRCGLGADTVDQDGAALRPQPFDGPDPFQQNVIQVRVLVVFGAVDQPDLDVG